MLVVLGTGKSRPHLALLILTVAGLVASCCSSDPPAGRTAGPTSHASVYFVVGTSGWSTKAAYKPRPDDPITSRAEPSLDWYAEHVRFLDPSRSMAVRLSGHEVPMARLEETLAGFSMRARQVHGLQARAGSGPDGPQVVLLPVGPGYTVMTLSYELSIDDLVEWTNALQEVDEAGWVAAGGVIAP